MGKLQVDNIVHSLTLAGKNKPGIPDVGLASLHEVKKRFGDTTFRFGAIESPSENHISQRVGIGSRVWQLNEGQEYL